MSKGDMEPYVRATAYKCLQEMVEINEFWNNLLQHNNTVLVSIWLLYYFYSHTERFIIYINDM